MPEFLFHARYVALIALVATCIVGDFEVVPLLAQGLRGVFGFGGSITTSGTHTEHLGYPLIGTFDTGEVHPINKSPWNGWISKTITFTKAYTHQPEVPVALTLLNVGNSHNVRVQCSSTSITEASFNINVYTWSGTQLYQGRCAWLELNHPDFQSGTCNTEEDHSWREPRIQNSRQIYFSRPYTKPPKVVVWLSRLDMRRDRNWRVEAFPTAITTTGFTIHIDTWGDSELYTAAATWVAYTTGIPGVHSGTIHSATSAADSTGYTKFGKRAFGTPPRVMLGISSLDIDCNHDLRLSVGTKSIEADGMTWYLKSWGDTRLYSATASYLALN